MGDRKETDIYEDRGIIAGRERVGRVDEARKVRKKGFLVDEEIAEIDQHGYVRKKEGLIDELTGGRIIGKLRDNALHGPGIFETEWGYMDEQGNVHQVASRSGEL